MIQLLHRPGRNEPLNRCFFKFHPSCRDCHREDPIGQVEPGAERSVGRTPPVIKRRNAGRTGGIRILHLDPAFAGAGLIGRSEALRDDAFQAQTAGSFKCFLAVALHMPDVLDAARPGYSTEWPYDLRAAAVADHRRRDGGDRTRRQSARARSSGCAVGPSSSVQISSDRSQPQL